MKKEFYANSTLFWTKVTTINLLAKSANYQSHLEAFKLETEKINFLIDESRPI